MDVGDKVRIKIDFEEIRFTGDPGINDEMRSFAGLEYTIKSIYGNKPHRKCNLEDEENIWTWAEDWLDVIESHEFVNIEEDDILSILER